MSAYIQYRPLVLGGGGGSGGVTSIGTIDTGTLSANGASISGSLLYMQSASATYPGLINLGTQTFSGAKNFLGAITVGPAAQFQVSTSGGITSASLTASQAVVTDGSHNLVSMAYTSLNTGSTICSRDANGNTAFNNVIVTTTSTVASGQTISMTVGSGGEQIVTGSGNITFNLPIASNLFIGESYRFNNNSTGTITVYESDGTTLVGTVTAGGLAETFCTDNSTADGTWDLHPYLAHASTSGTAGTTLLGTLTAGSLAITGNTLLTGTLQSGGTATTQALNLGQTVSVGSTIVGVNYGANPNFTGYRAQGTEASPTAVVGGNTLVNFIGRGYDGTAWGGTTAVELAMFAAENWSNTAHGTNMRFLTTPVTTTTLLERMRLTDAGNLLLGNTTGTSLLSVGSSAQLTVDTSGNLATSGTTNFNNSTGLTFAQPITAGNYIGAAGTGGSLLIETPSLSSAYTSGLGVSGTYTSGTKLSSVNIGAYGVYSGGGYQSNLTFSTTNNTTSATALTLDSSQNAVFGNNVTIPGTLGVTGVITSNAATMNLTPTTATNNAFMQWNNTGGQLIMGLDNNTGAHFGQGNYATGINAPGKIALLSSGTLALTLDTSQNATFAGTVFAVGQVTSSSTTGNTSFILTPKSGSAGQINNTTVGAPTNLYTSNASSDDTLALALSASGNATFAGTVTSTGLLTASAGISVSGSPTGYTGEVKFPQTPGSGNYAISTFDTGSPTMVFAHRGTSNTGTFAFGTGTGGSTVATITATGGATLSGAVTATVVSPTAAQTTLTGSAGTAVCSQPFQGSSYKKAIIYLNGYTDTGTQTYTFPTAFSHTPYIYGLAGGVSGATVTSTTIKFTTTTLSGFVICEGF